MTKILIPFETSIGERRVSATPETVKKLKNLGCDVYIEKSAGELSGFKDFSYEESGGIIFTKQDFNHWKEGFEWSLAFAEQEDINNHLPKNRI